FSQCSDAADYEFTGNTNDASSYNITGIDNGATLVPDRFGNPNSAYNFNGTSSYISCGTDNRGITSEVTLSAWIQTAQYVNGTNSIVGKYNSTEDQGYGLGVYKNIVVFEGRDGSGIYRKSGFSTTHITDGQWHLVTGVVRNGTWEISVDGVLEHDSVFSNPNPQLACTEPLAIGYASQGDNGFFQGTIDEVKLWPCALDPAAIAGMYSKPVCTDVTDYEFTGNTNDASSYNITGVDNGATLVSDR